MHSPEQQHFASHYPPWLCWKPTVRADVGLPTQSDRLCLSAQIMLSAFSPTQPLCSSQIAETCEIPSCCGSIYPSLSLRNQRQPAKNRSFFRHFYHLSVQRCGHKLNTNCSPVTGWAAEFLPPDALVRSLALHCCSQGCCGTYTHCCVDCSFFGGEINSLPIAERSGVGSAYLLPG